MISLSTVIMLLTLAVGLLSTPNLSANPIAQKSAFDFANQAVLIASEALKQPQETQLGAVISTSTPPEAPVIVTPVVAPAPTWGNWDWSAHPMGPWGCGVLPKCNDPTNDDYYHSHGALVPIEFISPSSTNPKEDQLERSYWFPNKTHPNRGYTVEEHQQMERERLASTTATTTSP